MDDATSSERDLAEIQDEAYGEPGQAKIGEKLGTVDRKDLRKRLHLDDDLVIDDHVQAKRLADDPTAEDDGYGDLLPNGESLMPKLVREAGLIGGFDQPDAESRWTSIAIR